MNTTHSSKRLAAIVLAGAALVAGLLLLIGHQATPAAGASTTTVALKISGGHRTNPVDNGRPVVLVAAGLGVPTDVFRQAFSGVSPAGAGEEPDPAQVQRNKAALLKVLAPYGVTNEDLDRVSDYYRYNESAGETWTHTTATGAATVKNGKVLSVKIVKAGAGYSSAPTVTVPGHPGVRVTAKVAYGKDLATNGALKSLALD